MRELHNFYADGFALIFCAFVATNCKIVSVSLIVSVRPFTSLSAGLLRCVYKTHTLPKFRYYVSLKLQLWPSRNTSLRKRAVVNAVRRNIFWLVHLYSPHFLQLRSEPQVAVHLSEVLYSVDSKIQWMYSIYDNKCWKWHPWATDSGHICHVKCCRYRK